jgi:hypothetical protein
VRKPGQLLRLGLQLALEVPRLSPQATPASAAGRALFQRLARPCSGCLRERDRLALFGDACLAIVQLLGRNMQDRWRCGQRSGRARKQGSSSALGSSLFLGISLALID